MKTNGKPEKIMQEAWDRARAIYPEGTRISVKLRDNWRTMFGVVEAHGWSTGHFTFIDDDTGKRHNFYPSMHPHQVLKS